MKLQLSRTLRIAVVAAVVACALLPALGKKTKSSYFRHGLAFPYRDFDNPRYPRRFMPATVSCRIPHHQVVLRNYSQFYDPDLVEDFWSPSGHVDEKEQRRYFVVKKLVTGAEGTVYEAVDLQTGQLVAIKKLINVFNDTHLATQVWTEARVLEITRVSPDIMRLNRVMKPKSVRTFNTVYIVLDMLEIGIPSGDHPSSGDILQRAAKETLRRRVFQFIRGVAFLHEANLVHNDLKWHNVMLDEDCNTIIIDLGNLTPVREVDSEAIMDDFPVFGDFGQFRRDIWMMGTTILTWLGGMEFHLDVHGTPVEKAKLIANALGYPPDEQLAGYSKEVRDGFAEAKRTAMDFPTLRERYHEVDFKLFNLLSEMMRFDRKVKPAKEYLDHPYFAGMEDQKHIAQVTEHNTAQIFQEGHDKCYESEKEARRMIYALALRNP